MMVPPRVRIPEISRGPSGWKSCSTIPRQPSRTPTTSCPRDHDRRATARMTAFSPGQSPPPVSTPIFIDLSLRSVAPAPAATRHHGAVHRVAVAFVAVLCVAATAATVSAGGGPTLAAKAPCPGAPGYTCSTLTVPLDHGGGTSGSLRLAVAAADNVRAPRGVLLLITGGPGQPGVPALARVSNILGAELQDYRVVVYDQRGTGAGALNCPALQAQMGSSDLWPP